MTDQFQIGRQADAHKLLVFLLDSMDQGGQHEVLYGTTQMALTCSNCPHRPVIQATTSHLSLDLERSMSSTVRQCLKAFFAPDSALDKFRCGRCDRADTSTQSSSISTPPNILMVYLKRLVIGKKIQRQLEFHVELDLNTYIAVKGAPLLYELIGVIEHISSHRDGRYIAVTRWEGSWSWCDNTTISLIALCDVLKCRAYILLYRKKETKKCLRGGSSANSSPQATGGFAANGGSAANSNFVAAGGSALLVILRSNGALQPKVDALRPIVALLLLVTLATPSPTATWNENMHMSRGKPQ